MKWKNPNPKDGDVRIIKRFALFPINTPHETRWLEFVRIEQRYEGYNWADDGWQNTQFIDSE
jgi:hypothetical protein